MDLFWNLLRLVGYPALGAVRERNPRTHRALPGDVDELRSLLGTFGELAFDQLGVTARVLLILVEPQLERFTVGGLVDVHTAAPLALIVGSVGAEGDPGHLDGLDRSADTIRPVALARPGLDGIQHVLDVFRIAGRVMAGTDSEGVQDDVSPIMDLRDLGGVNG